MDITEALLVIVVGLACLWGIHWHQMWLSAKRGYHWYIRYSWRWKVVARLSKRRDGWRCRGCGRSIHQVKLASHHPGEWGYSKLYKEKPSDLTTFCEDCHTFISYAIKLRKLGITMEWPVRL